MMERLQAAKRAGKAEEAKRIAHHIEEFRQHHARGARERAEQQTRRGREHHDGEHHGRGHDREAEEVERRVHHLREAAKNLAAAGFREQAEQAEREAHEIAQNFRRERAGHHEGHGPSNMELAEAVEKLQRQVHELGKIVSEMRGAFKARGR